MFQHHHMVKSAEHSIPVINGKIFKLLISALLIFWSISASAQVKMGVRVGLNMSTITHSTVELGVTRMAVGPGGGFVLHIPLTEIFAIHTELILNAKGIAASATLNGITQRASKHIYYVDLPFVIRGFYSLDKVRIHGGLGPQFGVGLWVQDITKTSGDHFTNKFSETSRFSDQTRRYEIAWDFDVGVSFPLKKGSELEINVRPSLGLINIAKEKYNEDNNRNFLVSFSVAYLIQR